MRTIAATQNVYHCTLFRRSHHHCCILPGSASSNTCFRITRRSCQYSKLPICLSSTFNCPDSLASGSRGSFRRFWSFAYCFSNQILVSLSCSGSKSAKVRRVSSMRAGGRRELEICQLTHSLSVVTYQVWTWRVLTCQSGTGMWLLLD
jgi:hypothetical protein